MIDILLLTRDKNHRLSTFVCPKKFYFCSLEKLQKIIGNDSW